LYEFRNVISSVFFLCRLYENTQNKKLGNKFYIDLVVREPGINFTLAEFNLDADEAMMCLSKEDLEKNVCQNYAVYGSCAHMVSKKCAKIHSVDEILKIELVTKQKRSKKARVENPVPGADKEEQTPENEKLVDDSIGLVGNHTHSAGLDAFMTGYIMLNYLNKFGKFKVKSGEEDAASSSCDILNLNRFEGLENFHSNVYLTGKDYPLMVKKSNFTSLSHNHQDKKARISTMSNKN
jgi:hypothetical protein